MIEQEGVIKFQLDFSVADVVAEKDIIELDSWRHIFYRMQWIGQQADRYGGYGFGNISQRCRQNPEQFFISGTQTGEAEFLAAAQYARVIECHPLENRIVAKGQTKPSSEAMTHGQVYQLSPSTQCVIHAHCPEIWRCADILCIPQTGAEVPYGTVQMAQEVNRLFKETDVTRQKIFTMQGHEDGVVCFAENWTLAAHLMIDCFNRALQVLVKRQI